MSRGSRAESSSDLGAGDERHRLSIDDGEDRRLGVLRRSDGQQHAVVFSVRRQVAQTKSGSPKICVPSLNEVDRPVSRSTLTMAEGYGPRASGPSDCAIREAIRHDR